MHQRLLLATVIAVLAACSETPADHPPRPAAPPVAVVPPPPAAIEPAPAAKALFTSTPASIRRCDAKDGNATVALAWDAAAAGAAFVTVIVDGKVLAEGTTTGTANTGEWVREETRFTLLDAATKQPLATLQIPFVEC